MFKPKQPHVILHPAKLENVQIQLSPLSFNATLGLTITIQNRNYGSFRFKNSTSYVNYHKTLVAELMIEEARIPPRGEINITTRADITADKLIIDPSFSKDIELGFLNLTSTANLHGKVSVLKIFKFGAVVHSTCNISVYILTQNVESKCHSRIKL